MSSGGSPGSAPVAKVPSCAGPLAVAPRCTTFDIFVAARGIDRAHHVVARRQRGRCEIGIGESRDPLRNAIAGGGDEAVAGAAIDRVGRRAAAVDRARRPGEVDRAGSRSLIRRAGDTGESGRRGAAAGGRGLDAGGRHRATDAGRVALLNAVTVGDDTRSGEVVVARRGEAAGDGLEGPAAATERTLDLEGRAGGAAAAPVQVDPVVAVRLCDEAGRGRRRGAQVRRTQDEEALLMWDTGMLPLAKNG